MSLRGWFATLLGVASGGTESPNEPLCATFRAEVALAQGAVEVGCLVDETDAQAAGGVGVGER